MAGNGAGTGVPRTGADRPAADRIAAGRRRAPPTPSRIRRRRFMVGTAKWLLPLGGMLLLTSIAAWPELVRVRDSAAVSIRRVLALDPDSGEMLQPRYRGVDERGRPYTVSATAAHETGPSTLALLAPHGDVVTESGAWLDVTAEQGVFLQRRSLLDLSGEVTLYRDDGTVLRTDTASVDLKAGAAASGDRTHTEGPFGVLDSQGFTLTDKGASIQFAGPAHLVLNGGTP